MNCPDCDFEMESEQQSGIIAEDRSGKVKTAVSVRYFCPNCKEYWRWVRGNRGLSRA